MQAEHFHTVREQAAKHAAGGELTAVLERVDQVIRWKAVGIGGVAAVDRARVPGQDQGLGPGW